MISVAVCVKLVDGDLNPFDECALEEALKINNAHVTVVSMGPMQWQSRLCFLTRLGDIDAVLLSDSAFAGSDTMATAYVLSSAMKKIKPDLIICGRQAIDGDTAQTPPAMSEKLGMNIITNVMKIKSVSDTVIECETRSGEREEKLPCIITVERINTLRLPKIRSHEKDIRIWNANDTGADKKLCGLTGSPTRVLKSFETVRDKRECKFMNPSEFKNLISELAARESKAPNEEKTADFKKLPEVCVIGDGLCDNALAVAEKFVKADRMPPEKIAEYLERSHAKYVLWPSDLWGRENAPIVASMLKTGLCADCTYLESDGDNLIMYRPAKGGSITAKIKCLTFPQMATVRMKGDREEIVLALGAGVAEYKSELYDYSKKIGADIASSRKLVDMGAAAYETQVGLTGKNVNAKIYIAVGISGAVQHTCAINGCEYVVAVNPDRDARIFECADFGFVCNAREIFDT